MILELVSRVPRSIGLDNFLFPGASLWLVITQGMSEQRVWAELTVPEMGL